MVGDGVWVGVQREVLEGVQRVGEGGRESEREVIDDDERGI